MSRQHNKRQRRRHHQQHLCSIYTSRILSLISTIIITALLTNLMPTAHSGKILSSSDDKISTEQRFAMEPQDQTAIVGSRVTLPCRVVSKKGSLQWTKDDFGLGEHRNLSGFERYSMVGSDEEGDFSLDIYPVMLDDDARYQCQVGPGPQGQPGIRSRFATLTVLVPPEAPKIVQGDYLLTTEDREIELECISVGGKPAAEITWIDGLGNVLSKNIDYVKEPLADSRRFTAKSILKLTPKKEHHNTTFTCQAQNTADRTYRSAKLFLEVKYAPKVTVSVIGGALAGGRIPEGTEVRLSCHADANPNDLQYKWYINDELVVGDYTTKMIIHNVSRKFHDAIVKCEVYNAVGKSEESETLDISYGPVFRHYPQSVQADLGSTVTLSCDVEGNPPPDIVWINEASDRVVGTSANLTIVVSEETAGHYYCKASVMGFPEIGAGAAIYLKRPPVIKSPKRQSGIIGDNAHIECIAFSVPKAKHVLWAFNGKEINISSDLDYSILEDILPEGIKSTLIIRESQEKHFGYYNCTVLNDYGSDVLEIEFFSQRQVSVLTLTVGTVSISLILVLILMILLVYLKRNKKKLPPADVITDHHHHHHHHLNHSANEKNLGIKESDQSSNISDIKTNEIRASSGGEQDYSETCSGTGSIVARFNFLNPPPSSGNNINKTELPCSPGGASKIPIDYRYSVDYSDNFHQIQPHSTKLSYQNKNIYFPDSYNEYSRDYNSPLQTNSNSSISTMQMNGHIPTDQDNLKDPKDSKNGITSIHSTLLGQPLLQNGLSIDLRYNATYGNPYLRTSNASLPPLPPPSTANPAATPAPPPYHHATRNHNNLNSSVAINNHHNGILTLGSSSLLNSNNSSNNLASTCTTQNPLLGQTQQQQLQQQQQLSAVSQSSGLATNSTGQFILSANGNLKKGSLATHV